MNFSVRHAMPGRLRLNVPELCRKRPLAEAVLRWLGVQSGVKAARINYDCASLVLEYDPAQEPVLRLLLERFRNASVEAEAPKKVEGQNQIGGNLPTPLKVADSSVDDLTKKS